MNQNSHKPKAVVLMSGGMDSCVTAAIARQDSIVLLKGAGHNPLTEMPDTSLPLVIKFLRDGEIEVPEMVETRAETSFHKNKPAGNSPVNELVTSPSKGSHI